jgi:hypothetical protein
MCKCVTGVNGVILNWYWLMCKWGSEKMGIWVIG